MPQIFIPQLDTEMVLDQPWRFTLENEHRNRAMLEVVAEKQLIPTQELIYRSDLDRYQRNEQNVVVLEDLEPGAWYGRLKVAYSKYDYPDETDVTLPAGSRLVVDRIYIRQNAEGFDSVTFRLLDCPDQRFQAQGKAKPFGKKGIRFWAQLLDVNHMSVTPMPRPAPTYASGQTLLVQMASYEVPREAEILEVDPDRAAPYRIRYIHSYRGLTTAWVSEKKLRPMAGQAG